ncbi:hypothetical protein [Bacillus cereus group sp. BfR-BA-01700]|uniref:hypothetical protein n=1 Tax=Bacillus cereus group sp. BfR-BA-01700 TaxID=3094884 RepID=UPI0029C55248|nr:hypothetical protein [Bacillus cereus group sp. BfR-BA-01700]MDX5841080.1 hypothetical protein [Bacillus cereus group sp. BfR-BA-01700]
MNKKMEKKEEEQKKQEVLRQVLAAKGMSEEEILDVLKDTEIKMTGRTDLDPKLKSVKETAAILEERLGGFWNERKVHRVIGRGELTPINLNTPRKLGYQLEMKDIENFIRLESQTTEDWKNSYYSEVKKYEDLKIQIENNQGKDAVELLEKIQELENKVDELQAKNDHLTEQNRKLLDGYNKDMAERPSKIKYEKTLKEKEETERQLKQLKEENSVSKEQNDQLISETKDVAAETNTEELEQLLKEKNELETTVKENDQTITKQRTENDKKDRKIKRLEKKIKDLEAKEITVE